MISIQYVNCQYLVIVLEPTRLYGEGQYNLNVVKEMKVTDSFLTLEPSRRNCQDTIDYEECTTKTYHNAFMEQCRCLPFNIETNKVTINKCSNHVSSFLTLPALAEMDNIFPGAFSL